MKEIKLVYKPVSWLGISRRVTGLHPENWNEVTAAQLIAVASSYQLKISPHKFLSVMTGIRPGILRKLDDFQHFNLLHLIEFVNDNKPFHEFILKSVELEGKTFYGSLPQLRKVTFGQFIFADSYFNQFSEHSLPEDLNKFLASLYTPISGRFKQSYIDKYYPCFEKLGADSKEAILINYMLVKQWLSVKYPLLFVSEMEDKETASQKKKTNHDPMGWVKVLETLVGDDISNHKKYTCLPLHNVLRFLTRKIKESAKHK